MKKIKNENGSVTLFVLIAVFFFTAILLGVYNSNMNKLQAQDKDISRIQESYQKNMKEEYEKAIQNQSNNTKT